MSDHTPSSFPSRAGLGGPLTGDDLRLLFETVDTDDRDFWRRIGRNVRLPLVAALDLPDGSPNLERFVEANQDRLSARAVRVLDQPADLLEDQTVKWLAARGCLVLRGETWSAYFAPTADDLPPAQLRREVMLSRLRERVRSLGLLMTDVNVRQTDFAISIESIEEANVVDSPDFADLADRDAGTVRSAAIALSGRNLIVDFVTGTASGHTNASFLLAEVGPTALGLLLDLQEIETQAVQAKLVVDPDDLEDGHQLTIFDVSTD